MKLKILFMPFAVIVSMYLIIWHIYPTAFGSGADSISAIRSRIGALEAELSTIKVKKQNVDSLNDFLSSDNELKDAVLKYYSNVRKDEDFIGNINNIAFGEGVYLDDLDIEYGNFNNKTSDPVKLMALKNITAVKTDNADSDLGNSNSLDKSLPNAKIGYVAAKIQGWGDYFQLKNFLISLDKVGLLNNIQSFSIGKDADPNNENGGLKMNAKIGFGYFKSSKDEIANLLMEPALSLNSFDLSEIEKNRELITGNYQPSEVGEIGVTNPFSAN